MVRAPITIRLTLLALLFEATVGILAGVLAGLRAAVAAFAAAVEEMIRAYNIIGKYDSATMAEVWNERIMRGEWEFGEIEETLWPQIVIGAQRVRIWLAKNPELVRLMKDLRTIGIEYEPGGRTPTTRN